VSIHKSLKLSKAGGGHRNVLTRWERLQKLREQERWSEGDKVFGLPKVRTEKIKVGGKKKKAAPTKDEDEAKK